MSPQVTAAHLANFLLAQVAHLPSGSGKAVAALRDLPLAYYNVDVDVVPWTKPDQTPPAKTLGKMLEFMIDAAADPEWRAEHTDSPAHLWNLTVRLDRPVWATMELREGPRNEFATFGRQTGSDVERTVSIGIRPLLLCGELWADSKAKLAVQVKNADPLAGGPAPSKAPTAQQQGPNSSDATARVRAPAISPGGAYARYRRRSPVPTAPGAA
jgi:hypothetical protein